MNFLISYLHKVGIFLLVLIASIGISVAQPPDGGGDGEDPDAAIPIDGGVSFLAAAGLAYGAKKIHDKRKKKEEENL